MGKTTARGALALVAVIALAGCARFNATSAASPDTPVASSSVDATDSNGMRPGVFPSTRVEPPPGADRPDGPPPTPDSDLTTDDLARLLATSASASRAADSCTAAGTRLSLTAADYALGHRYARLIAENTTDQPCQLIGWPGLGLRGEWGTAFAIVAERSSIPVDWAGVPATEVNAAVIVPAGGRAGADFEWTGSLGGNRDEHVSLIAVQLTDGDNPVPTIIDPAANVDIGPDTTVRVGTWRPAI